MVFRRTNGEISWSCNACGDEGVIGGWEGSPSDLSGLDDSYAQGNMVVLLVDRAVVEVLRDVLLMDAASELLIARAEGRSDGVLLAGRVDAFEELIAYVAAETNAESNRRRQRRLDEVCTTLEAALAGM